MVRKGISLIEVLAVIAIIAIIAALSIPAYVRAKEQSKYTICLSHLHQIGLATLAYEGDHDGQLPHVNPGGQDGNPDVLSPYGVVKAIYDCPAKTYTWNFPYYIFRFQIDFSELDKNKSWPFMIVPQPMSVLAWDWNHSHGKPNIEAADFWNVMRADCSTQKVNRGAIKKSYLYSDGSWKDVPPKTGPVFYQFVFPNEPWPPEFVPLPR